MRRNQARQPRLVTRPPPDLGGRKGRLRAYALRAKLPAIGLGGSLEPFKFLDLAPPDLGTDDRLQQSAGRAEPQPAGLAEQRSAAPAACSRYSPSQTIGPVRRGPGDASQAARTGT